jgi:hypothetical protein
MKTLAALVCFSMALAAALAAGGNDSQPSAPPQAELSPADLHLRPARPAAPALPSAARAHAAFWQAFEGERYEAIPAVVQQLGGAFAENPRDAQTALLLGHSHLWKAAERTREGKRDPSTIDHVVLAEHYFEQAHRLAPEDHRILGWLGSTRLSLGAARRDDALRGEGDRMLDEAVRRHPRFNLFTAGFVRASLPASDPKFHTALEQMWRNIESCSGVTPGAAEGGEVNIYELAQRADPVCANTEKAPHNFEGFILVLGDMLMKAGKEEQAVDVYARAKLAPTYTVWPYREVLEKRVQDAPETARRVRNGEPAPMVSGSAYTCVACHARR